MLALPVPVPVIVAEVDVAALPVVATDASELLHVPPIVVVLSVVILPLHKVSVPVITAGIEPTVTSLVAKHPPAVV